VPAGHASHDVLPATEMKPSEHATHAPELLAPVASEYLPAGQPEHAWSALSKSAHTSAISNEQPWPHEPDASDVISSSFRHNLHPCPSHRALASQNVFFAAVLLPLKQPSRVAANSPGICNMKCICHLNMYISYIHRIIMYMSLECVYSINT
jgi:hypothetical protein